MKRSRSKFSGKNLKKLVTKNPRRPNTHGARHWKLYRDGMTYEELASKAEFGYKHFAASVHVEQAGWNREFDDRKGPRRFARFARRAAARDQHRT